MRDLVQTPRTGSSNRQRFRSNSPPSVTRYPRVSFPENKTSKSAVRSSREGLPRSSSERLRLLEAVENALEFLCPFGLALRLRILDVFVDKALDLAYSFF